MAIRAPDGANKKMLEQIPAERKFKIAFRNSFRRTLLFKYCTAIERIKVSPTKNKTLLITTSDRVCIVTVLW